MAPGSIGTLYYVQETVYKAEKALVAAKFNGIKIETEKFVAVKDASKPEFKTKNPTGKVPYLETDGGCICSSNAIARYVAQARGDTGIFGKSFDDEGQIEEWLEFCIRDIEVPLMTWVYPTMGLMQDVPKATTEAQADVKKALQQIEAKLATSQYLVGDFLTLADIVIVCALREGFARVLDPAFRKPFPKTTTWFETCCGMPQFKSVFTTPARLCSEMAKPVAAKGGNFNPPARDAKKEASPKAAAKASPKSAPKEEKKKAASPKAAPAVAGASGADVEAQIKAVGDKIRELKDKLKAQGLSGKKINDNDEVKACVAELTDLKAKMPAGGAAPAPTVASPKAAAKSPKGSPKSAPVAAPDGDIEAQVKAVGDQIRAAKEKLKADGLSGKKINEHASVCELVAKLQELKSKM